MSSPVRFHKSPARMAGLLVAGLFACFYLPTYACCAFEGVDLLGVGSAPVKQSGPSQIPAGYLRRSRIERVQGPGGDRKVDIASLERDGRSYVAPQAACQLFPGTSVSTVGDMFIFIRADGASLSIVISGNMLMISFNGARIDTGMTVVTDGNGSPYLPLDTLGAFYGRQYTRDGGTLRATSGYPDWLRNSWRNTLRNSGDLAYRDNIGNAASAPTGKVFRRITATVFSSRESGRKGFYGEWLRANDYYVALPYRFRGRRPKVAVRAHGRTIVAPIKDVGPWNVNDPYWVRGGRPQAESGRDKRGRRTNRAGIDLSPRMGRELGIGGKGLVDWWFVK